MALLDVALGLMLCIMCEYVVYLIMHPVGDPRLELSGVVER